MLQKDHQTRFVSDLLGDTGLWDHVSGGAYGADATSYTPADLRERKYPANATTDDFVLQRKYNPAVDGAILAKMRQLYNTWGTVAPLDLDPGSGTYRANQAGQRGFVSHIEPPERDSNSNEVAMISITVSIGQQGE